MIRPPVFVLHASVSPLRGGSPWRETIPGNWASAVQRLAIFAFDHPGKLVWLVGVAFWRNRPRYHCWLYFL